MHKFKSESIPKISNEMWRLVQEFDTSISRQILVYF